MIWEVARPQGLRVAFQAPEEAEGSRTAVHVRSTWRRLSKRRHKGEEHQRITPVSSQDMGGRGGGFVLRCYVSPEGASDPGGGVYAEAGGRTVGRKRREVKDKSLG